MPESLKLGHAAQLRVFACVLRQYPLPAELADGFDLIADVMEPCIDCGHDELPEPATLHLVESTLTSTTATVQ